MAKPQSRLLVRGQLLRILLRRWTRRAVFSWVLIIVLPLPGELLDAEISAEWRIPRRFRYSCGTHYPCLPLLGQGCASALVHRHTQVPPKIVSIAGRDRIDPPIGPEVIDQVVAAPFQVVARVGFHVYPALDVIVDKRGERLVSSRFALRQQVGRRELVVQVSVVALLLRHPARGLGFPGVSADCGVVRRFDLRLDFRSSIARNFAKPDAQP